MSHRTAILLSLVLLAGSLPVQAGKLGVGVRAGTQGAGAEFGIGVSDRFTLRAGYYTADLSEDYDDAGIVYDGDLQIGGSGVIADFHPFKGSFHVSAGVFSNENELTIIATPTMSEFIGGTLYTPAEIGTLSGEISFDSTAPYFGIGWGRITGDKRLGFLFDLGILAQGSGDVVLTSSTGLIDAADLQAEIAEIEADIEDFDFWPVISFGLAIRF